MLEARLVREIVGVLEPLGLQALWVFGSVAADRARADSDLDLAGLFVRPPDLDALLGARADLVAIVGREVDLVDLEQVSPILAMQALKHGQLVYEAHPGRRVLFTAQLVSRYEDVRIMQRPIVHAAMERLRGRT